MLNSVFKDAIQNREKTLSILKGPKYEKIIQKAKENWVEYKPHKQDVVSAGIDSTVLSSLMAELRVKYGFSLYLMHFNHGVHEKAKSMEQFCRSFARINNVKYY